MLRAGTVDSRQTQAIRKKTILVFLNNASLQTTLKATSLISLFLLFYSLFLLFLLLHLLFLLLPPLPPPILHSPLLLFVIFHHFLHLFLSSSSSKSQTSCSFFKNITINRLQPQGSKGRFRTCPRGQGLITMQHNNRQCLPQ